MTKAVNLIKRKCLVILLNNDGIGVIEFAVLLPILLIIVLGIIEFGMFFVKSEIIASTVSNISLTLQRTPTYFSSMNPTQQNAWLAGIGSGLIKFSNVGDISPGGNHLCVDAYTTVNASLIVPPCTITHFNTSNPNVNHEIPYYISVRINLAKSTVTPLGAFVPVVKNIEINQSSGSVQVGAMIPPNCMQTGYALQYDAKKGLFLCNPIAPNCRGMR